MTGLAARAGTWGIVMGISPLLRIRRVMERGSSADVSIGYPSVLIVAFAFWATYAVSRSRTRRSWPPTASQR
ncbi:MAG: hypothetical protein ACLQBX_19830 [Candidatus Limnocylindrales bacterium]|jgi:hypothetical protein